MCLLILGGKFMKKQVKKFISAVLASTMAVTGVAVTNFAVTPVSVLAASNIAVYESSGWMESCYVEWIGGDLCKECKRF